MASSQLYGSPLAWMTTPPPSYKRLKLGHPSKCILALRFAQRPLFHQLYFGDKGSSRITLCRLFTNQTLLVIAKWEGLQVKRLGTGADDMVSFIWL